MGHNKRTGSSVSGTRVLHPEWYHGQGKKPPFFEGWYYKLVDASGQHRYAIIPGIFLSRDPNQHHAFIQVLNGVTGTASYHRYPAEEFVATKKAFDVRVGSSRFTTQSLVLDIQSERETIRGQVQLDDLTPWPITLISPGIMGWYSWMPFMECYHGVLSLDHALRGTLTVNGAEIDWTGGRGYVEKDWGMSFPSAWVWMQSNHFAQPGISITASVAIIPWLFRSFRGMIVGLWHDGQLYRFATYTGAQTEHLAITDDRVRWAIRDRRHRLEIQASRMQSAPLRGPSRVDMGMRVPETLEATIDVRLTAFQGKRRGLVFEGRGQFAGLEVGGAVEQLLS
jgi:tocopherol cyclase